MAGEGEGVLNYRRPGEVGHADYSIRRTLRQSIEKIVLVKRTRKYNKLAAISRSSRLPI